MDIQDFKDMCLKLHQKRAQNPSPLAVEPESYVDLEYYDEEDSSWMAVALLAGIVKIVTD